MKNISIDKVCQQIERRNYDRIKVARERGIQIIPYSDKDFMADALADGFILSKPTVSTKWLALTASGIVIPVGSKTCLDLDALRKAATPGINGFARRCV